MRNVVVSLVPEVNMVDALPAPLVPAEVDLRDYDYMPFYGAKALASDTWSLCDAEEKVAALTGWWASWHQEPAGSLPDNDRILAKLLGYGVAVKEFQRVKANAMRGWIKCSNGRLYHPVVASIVLDVWATKRKKREENAADRERKRLKRLGLSGGQRDNSGGQTSDKAPQSVRPSGGLPPENALKGREENIPPNPHEDVGGSDRNRSGGEVGRRPSRADGNSPRQVAQRAADEAEARQRAERQAEAEAPWLRKLDAFEAGEAWNLSDWGRPPSANPAIKETGVLLPPSLWPRYFAILKARTKPNKTGGI